VAVVFVVAHRGRAEIGPLLGELDRWAATNGHRLLIEPEDLAAHRVGALVATEEGDPQEADVVVSYGGDGTILRAVQRIDGAPTPVLGVNVGTLGYLTETDPSEALEVLGSWLEAGVSAGFVIDRRMMLRTELRRAAAAETLVWRSLNETVIEKQHSGHTVWMDVSIDGEVFARYSADGLIVATPTGSTAYSMSARGPLVSPRHRAILVTPVSPHMLFDRSLVLDPSEEVHIALVGSRPADLAVDGRRVASLQPGDAVTFGPDAAEAIFVRRATPRFHQIVRAKFSLGE